MLSSDPIARNAVFNVAYGERTNLIELVDLLKESLSRFDASILKIQPTFGPERSGDVPHSLASIEKARKILGYDPKFDIKKGLDEATHWYWKNL